MTALVRRCRPVRQSHRDRTRGTRRMTHQPEPPVTLPAMKGFRPIVTPTLRPYPSPLPLPPPTHKADNRSRTILVAAVRELLRRGMASAALRARDPGASRPSRLGLYGS